MDGTSCSTENPLSSISRLLNSNSFTHNPKAPVHREEWQEESSSQVRKDGSEVLNFLSGSSYTDQMYADLLSQNQSSCQRHSLSTCDLLKEGYNLVEYLSLNCYTDDVYGDLTKAISDFQEIARNGKKPQRNEGGLRQAVVRLRMFRAHLNPSLN